jgi:hypothetical protein
MPERGFFQRFVVPVCSVMIPLALSFLIYFNAARIDNHALHQVVAMVSGIVMIAAAMLGAGVIYPLMFFRGAQRWEKIVGSLVPAIAFDAYEVYVATGVFPLPDSLYYALNPTAVVVFLLAFGLMGACELVCRSIIRRRGEQVRLLTPTPVAAIAAMIAGIYVALIWGNGAHFFYFYINSYIFFFKS